MFSNLILIVTIFCLLTFFVTSLEYKINKDILNSAKSHDSKVKYISTYEEIRKIVFEEKKNSIIVFYADWCPHW